MGNAYRLTHWPASASRSLDIHVNSLHVVECTQSQQIRSLYQLSMETKFKLFLDFFRKNIISHSITTFIKQTILTLEWGTYRWWIIK